MTTLTNIAIFYALWLGILTSISPCPLATNIAAITYISKDFKNQLIVLLSGIFYSIGRSLTYILICTVIVTSIMSSSQLAQFLQTYMNMLLGPILIIAGMILLELIKLSLPGLNISSTFQNKIKKHGISGSFFIGILFALSFCPVSAGLFFGGLIPLAIKENSRLLLPLFYGIGTSIPVIVFAVLIAFGSKSISKIFNKISLFEIWARKITGIVFILVGIYYSLIYIFRLI
ncbi:MAG: aromatic aminobenezylarsenical efflux permease ArsG family transporter [Pseudomonadota bacterium]